MKLSVGGIYGTAVSMASNTCGNTVSIQPLQTVVAHASGATTFTLTRGVTHSGTINSVAEVAGR